MAKTSKYPHGAVWRKWDLHIHTPETLKEDNYAGAAAEEKWVNFCKTINESPEDISVIGVTDYLLLDNYKKFVSLVEEGKITKKFDLIIPNLELRLAPVTADGKALNLHLLFDPAFVPQIEERVFSKLTIKSGNTIYNATRDGLIRLGRFINSSLTDDEAYKQGARKFIIDFDTLKTVFDNDLSLAEHCIVAVSNKTTDGASGITQHSSFFTGNKSDLDIKRQAIYKFSKAIFSANPADRAYFLGNSVDDKETVIQKCGSLKPCIHGSDAHENAKVFNPDEGRFCWIKADPKFEGLKQIIYEPKDRVWIGPVKPDQKDDYKIIGKIKFKESDDFPEEIVFNQNLCSIIGSRSSGKSALLAYLADSVDPVFTRDLISGPAEGIHWDKVEFEYSIEWDNGKSNADSPGNVVFIPQNHLYNISREPDEIKKKIEPVLFKALPAFKAKYEKITADIDTVNQSISDNTDIWFNLTEIRRTHEENFKNLGDKKAIETSKAEVEAKIKHLEEKAKLSGDELKHYQEISSSLSTLENRIKEIEGELAKLPAHPDQSPFFSGAKVTLSPASAALPKKLQDLIRDVLKRSESGILADTNMKVASYKAMITDEKAQAATQIEKINKDSSVLIEKYKGNLELNNLVAKLNEYVETITKIDAIEMEIKSIRAEITTAVDAIKTDINQRDALLKSLSDAIKAEDQKSLPGIIFDVEYGWDESHDAVLGRLNLKESTDFVKANSVNLAAIKKNPGEFLAAIQSGKQKIRAGNDRNEVVRDVLALTEKILFSATMEDDRIGGFLESTMTPGKRALFALKLILTESDDVWPLLIDQPEDDLDSRSIYDEIVPFLKEKKKERQIIMVSHNANLVIASDSEQVVVANRNGNDRKNADGKQFNYLTGSLEFTDKKDCSCIDTLKAQGVCEHACEILDGGKQAFENRQNKYNIRR